MKQLNIVKKCLGKEKLVEIVHQQIKKIIHTKAYQKNKFTRVEQKIKQMVDNEKDTSYENQT